MLYLTSEIQKQFQNIVEEVDWLSSSTKETARNKLDAMIHNIGYPDLVLNDTELSTEIEGVREFFFFYFTPSLARNLTILGELN